MKSEKKIELLKKGWQEKEIKKAESILEKEEHHDVFFSKIVFWSALVVTVFANLLISLILIPFLVVLDSWFLFSIIILLGGMIGFLYNFLITDIGHLKKTHHLLAGIILPIIALGNMIMMVFVANRFAVDLKIKNMHNPWLIGLVFALAFIFPFIIDQIRLKLKK